MTDERQEYLGDGVYAETDGYHIILTVPGTAHQTGLDQRIAMEPPVMRMLERYQHMLDLEYAARKAAESEEKGG